MKKLLILLVLLALLPAVTLAQDGPILPPDQLGEDLCGLVFSLNAGTLTEIHNYNLTLIEEVTDMETPPENITYNMMELPHGTALAKWWEWIDGELVLFGDYPLDEFNEEVDEMYLFVSYELDEWLSLYTSATYASWIPSGREKYMYFFMPDEEESQASSIYAVGPGINWVELDC